MEVLIEKLDHQGRGITHIDGKIIFVESALPNEIVDIDIINDKKKYAEAVINRIIKRSKNRVDIICPYYKECGGCDLLHLEYNEQLKYKQIKVKEIMKKYADIIDENKVKDIVPSPKQFNYRNKVTLKNNGKIGYYKKKSNQIINIDYCYLANNSINNTIKKLNNEIIEPAVKELIIRDVNEEDKCLTLCLQNAINNKKSYDKYSILADKVNLFFQNKIYNITPKGNIIGKLGNCMFEISPSAFFQVNTEQTINLYNTILEEIKKYSFPKVLDLYCGTGTIGIYISSYASEVLGIEINPKSIEDAKLNMKLNNANNIRFISGDTKDILNRNNSMADIVIVDPPRAGLDKLVIDDLIKGNAKEIIYVSCDPVTLARDIKLFSNFYEVESITPFDMFPNTFHVENICILKQKQK